MTAGGRENCYVFKAGKKSNEYDPEQQAAIVHPCVHKGERTSSELFPYIRDHIW